MQETIVKNTVTNKFPVDKNNWLVQKQTKFFVYHHRDLKDHEFFGHEEMLLNSKDRLN